MSRRNLGALLLPIAVAAAATAGCRGEKSEDPPFHLIDDMQDQAHRGPQSESAVFDDKRSNRRYDEHAVARGRSRVTPGLGANGRYDGAFLRENDAYYKGVDTGGNVLKRIPYEITQDFIDRGRERFNIYCSPCHDKTASGHGLVAQHSGGVFDNIPDLAQTDRLRDAPDGEIFQTITNGKSRMPSYASQIPAEDRWKIIAWVRVLQQSQHATVADAAGNAVQPQEQEPK